MRTQDFWLQLIIPHPVDLPEHWFFPRNLSYTHHKEINLIANIWGRNVAATQVLRAESMMRPVVFWLQKTSLFSISSKSPFQHYIFLWNCLTFHHTHNLYDFYGPGTDVAQGIVLVGIPKPCLVIALFCTLEFVAALFTFSTKSQWGKFSFLRYFS